jgi:hypothetical protein
LHGIPAVLALLCTSAVLRISEIHDEINKLEIPEIASEIAILNGKIYSV